MERGGRRRRRVHGLEVNGGGVLATSMAEGK